MNKPFRTRFAPSPTGFIHVGNIRTALFAWLAARSNNGSFILRIEDTDKSREVAGSMQHIIDALDWLGLTPDEGPVQGGSFGPYTQSERLELYRSYAEKLIAKGLAYVDPYSAQEVDAFREQATTAKLPFLYRNHRPQDLHVPADWYGKHSLRLKTPAIKRYTWHDAVRGTLSAGEEALDDFVLIKSDGYPTYNFAHIVDDQEMQISHIIRGEEFISSMPKFLSLYEALQIEPPVFVTAPSILGLTGGKKMSKRDGAKDVLEYRTDNYLPQAINNFLVSLGWNDGTQKEIFTEAELITAFSLERIQKSPARYDATKLEWIEWQHRLLQLSKNAELFLADLGYSSEQISASFAELAATKSRSLAEFKDQYSIYTDPGTFALTDQTLALIDAELTKAIADSYITAAVKTLVELNDMSEASVEAALRGTMADLQASPRAFLNLLRWSLSNKKVSPNLFATISILGKQKTIDRLTATQTC